MANFVFNRALGRLAAYAELGQANDAIVLVLLEETGLESDAVLKDKATLADVVSGTTNEQTSLPRKNLTNVTVTVDNTTDTVKVSADPVEWTSPSGNIVKAAVICVDFDTTTGTDANIIPLCKHDLTWNPSDGVTFDLTLTNFYQAS